jgi:eukaryotic-like serine/threonine-protein kinase
MISRASSLAARALCAVAWAAVVAACGWQSAPRPLPVRFTFPVPGDRTLNAFAVSPDGRWFAYSAEHEGDGLRRLFIRSVAEGSQDDRELPDSAGASTPFFSPDSASVAYFSRGAIWRTPVSTATSPQRVVDAPSDSAGGTWTPDNRIVFAPLGNQGLMEVAASGGGTALPLTSLNAKDEELEHGWPHALADGAIVFTVSQRGRDPHVEVLSREKGRRRLRVPIIGQAQFVETGHLVYSYLGNLMAVRFDPAAHTISDVPVSIAKGIQTSAGFGVLGRSAFSVSRTGTLAWLRASPDDGRSRLMRVDRDGKVSRLATSTEVFQTPRLSPDGNRLAVVVRSGIMTREIRIMNAARPDSVTLTLAGGDNQSPAWMDNRRLTFGSNREGLQKIYVVSVDRKTPPRPLFTADATVARNPASWSRPPRLLALYEIEPSRGRDVLVYRIGESIAPVAATNANERSPTVSPDGRWIAYVADTSGRDEVYVTRLDRDAETVRLTSTGASEPLWTRDGLVYRESDKMMLRALEKGVLADPRLLFEGHFERDLGSNLAAYDVDRLGRFIMLKSANKPREVRIVQNWGQELP